MIRHIPKVLYHWRAHKKSTALSENNKPYAHLAALKEAGIMTSIANAEIINEIR